MPTVAPPTQKPVSASHSPAPGRTTVALDDLAGIVNALTHADNMVGHWRTAATELRRQITDRLGTAEVGTIDGRPVVKHTTYEDRRVSAKQLKELAPPELVEACTTTTSRRRFTLVTPDDGGQP